MHIQLVGLHTLPEIHSGDDLAVLIRRSAEKENYSLDHRTIVVIAQKIVSKAEGAVVDLRTIEPSSAAKDWASQWGKDPRLIELIFRQSCRIVKMERGVLITETHHGFITANAGVDQSNVPGEDHVTILPADPDASARRLHTELAC